MEESHSPSQSALAWGGINLFVQCRGKKKEFKAGQGWPIFDPCKCASSASCTFSCGDLLFLGGENCFEALLCVLYGKTFLPTGKDNLKIVISVTGNPKVKLKKGNLFL